MKYLTDKKELEETLQWFDVAATLATTATCGVKRSGSVIVKNNEVVGYGWSSPPQEDDRYRHCDDMIKIQEGNDVQCCIHAEQRALIDGLTRHADALKGARMHIIWLDMDGNRLKEGMSCIRCNQLALDVGIEEIVLLKEGGICIQYTYE